MLEDDGRWELHRPELSFRIWKFWKSFDFSIPLFSGGILEWPDWLVEDVQTLNFLNRLMRHAMRLDD